MGTEPSTRSALDNLVATATKLNNKDPFAEYSELMQLVRSADAHLAINDMSGLQEIHDRLGQLNARSLSDLDDALELCVLRVQIKIRETIGGKYGLG
jgi:hypothetical protein